MIVDTSAIIAVILKEENWLQLYQKMLDEPDLRMSSGTLQELLIVAYRKNILAQVKAFIDEIDLDIIAVEKVHAIKALEVYQLYGKGNHHPAQLNFGDCFALALAILSDQPLLYSGQDFKHAGY